MSNLQLVDFQVPSVVPFVEWACVRSQPAAAVASSFMVALPPTTILIVMSALEKLLCFQAFQRARNKQALKCRSICCSIHPKCDLPTNENEGSPNRANSKQDAQHSIAQCLLARWVVRVLAVFEMDFEGMESYSKGDRSQRRLSWFQVETDGIIYFYILLLTAAKRTAHKR